MDSFYHSEYQASRNVEAPTTAPSTEEESLFVDNYDYAHRPPSNESTDLSTANSPFGSDKPGGHWNTQPNVPVQYTGVPLTHRVRPLHPNLPWPPQDDSQYGIGQSMPSMPAEGSFPPPQPYQDTINNDDVFEYLSEHYGGNQALNTTFVPSTPLPTYDSRTNVPQIRPMEQQLSTSYSSPPDTLGRSSSGNKRKRVGVDQWQPVDSMLLVGRPLTPAGEQMLSIWHQTHQRMPMEGELVALSVVTGAAERAITYWLSCHRSPPFPVPMTLPIPPSSGSSSNNVPTTPTPTASSRKNTCNVKKRVPKPWNKVWDEEKPYSCLCRCGWTFTKKGDWIKHEKINFPEHTFHCPVPDCRSNFGRKDKCRDHIRKVHKISQTEQFDLDSRRTSVAQDHNDRCGFCGHFCTSWQEWYDHVGAHFENRIEGGPWTMSMWRYPWIYDAEAGHGDEGPDDGNDPDNGGNDDSEKDAEHETDDSFNGYEGGGPSHGSKRGGGDSGGRQSRSGGGRSGFQHMGAKYCTRSSHPPAPSALSEALKAASRTNSMPQLNQQHPRRRTKKNKKQDQLKMNHPITWPLTEEQAVPKVAPGSSLRTERINPLVDLAVAGKSARDAHIAELAPYLEDKAQVMSQPSLRGKPDEAPTQTANLSVVNVSSHMDVTSEDFKESNGRKHQDLLDRIDDLRSLSVGEVDLPQLIVCGDQSSGKSSILDTITGIPFPRKDIQSTRFATEVILKPKDDYSLLLSSDPAAERSLSRRVLKDKAQMPVQRCSNCDKEFKRPCDLTKHEKTHSRPWKCENEECKYHTLGWPTEKERDRHMNDKHSGAAALYPLCGYQFNRKTIFRQHMEKAHNSQSVRFQNNGWDSKKLIKDGPTGIKHKDLKTQEEPQRTLRPLADATESVRTRQPTVDADRVRRQAESLRETRLNCSTKAPEVIAPPIPPDLDVNLPHPPQTTDTGRATSDLMDQSWFSRRWGVQEKVAANNVIAVMGLTGVGKSSFIRSLSGIHEAEEEKGVSAGLATGQIGAIQVGGRRVMLIDTPGFDDTERTHAEVLTEIGRFLEAQYPSGTNLMGIIYIHPIRDTRHQTSSLRNLRIFRKLCGDSHLANVVLATTRWRGVNEPANTSWEKEQLLYSIFGTQDYEQPSRRPAPLRRDTFRANLIRKQRKPNTLPCPNNLSQHWKSSGDVFSFDLGQTQESQDETTNATCRPPRDCLGDLNQSESDQDSRAIIGTNNAMTKTSRTSTSLPDGPGQHNRPTTNGGSSFIVGPGDMIAMIHLVHKIAKSLFEPVNTRSKAQEQLNSLARDVMSLASRLYLLVEMLGTSSNIIEQDMLLTLFQDCKATFKEIGAHIGEIQRRPVGAERGVASSLRNLKTKELQRRLNSTGSKLSLILSPLTLNAALSRRKNEWTRHIANVEDLLVFDNGSSIPRELPTLDLFPPVPNWLSPSASNLRSWLFDSRLNTCKRLECLQARSSYGVQSYSTYLDLKPANILISDSGRTTITDFGRSLTSCQIQPPKALPYGDNSASEEPWSGYVDLYLIAYSKALRGPMIKRCTDRESLDLDFQKDDRAALDLKWLKQMGLEPGALELIETTAHSFNQLPSSTRGLLYVLTYLDPQKLSGYLMESASLATWPQCVTDASNHGVSEMLLRLINESLDRYARGVAGAMKDHIIEIDSDIDNVKSKIPTIYSSRQVPTTELHKAEYPLVNDRRIIRSSSGGIETRSEVTEFAGHLAPDEPFAEHHAVQLIDGSMMGIPHHEVVRQERETSLKKSIFDATVSGDLELLETLISEGSRSTQQSPWHQRTGNLKNLPLLDIQSLEDLLQLVEEQKLGSAATTILSAATTILSAAVRFYRQDRLKTSNHNEEAGNDGGKKEPVLGGNSLEQEYPTIAGSPMGRVLDVSRPRSSPIGTREQDAGDERSAQMRF